MWYFSQRVIKGRPLHHRVKPRRLGTCVMNSRPSGAGTWGYFINPEAQCSYRTKAPPLSKPQTTTKTNSQVIVRSGASLHILNVIPLSINININTAYSVNRNTASVYCHSKYSSTLAGVVLFFHLHKMSESKFKTHSLNKKNIKTDRAGHLMKVFLGYGRQAV